MRQDARDCTNSGVVRLLLHLLLQPKSLKERDEGCLNPKPESRDDETLKLKLPKQAILFRDSRFT